MISDTGDLTLSGGIKDKIDERIQKVLSHGKYILGPEVAELEESDYGS